MAFDANEAKLRLAASTAALFDVGFSFRKSLEKATVKKAVDVYSTVLKMTKTRSDAIIEHKLAIAKLMMEHEFAIKFEFTRLFESLANRKLDRVMDAPVVQLKFNDLQSVYRRTSAFEVDPKTQRVVVTPTQILSQSNEFRETIHADIENSDLQPTGSQRMVRTAATNSCSKSMSAKRELFLPPVVTTKQNDECAIPKGKRKDNEDPIKNDALENECVRSEEIEFAIGESGPESGVFSSDGSSQEGTAGENVCCTVVSSKASKKSRWT